MIAYRVHSKQCEPTTLLFAPIYAFTKKKTALWYQKKYMKEQGRIIKIYGYNGRKHKDHKDQRIFDMAIILEID